MRRSKFIIAIVAAIALALILAVPAMGWWYVGTKATISASSTEVVAGGTVLLTITETNNSLSLKWSSSYQPVWVELQPLGLRLDNTSTSYGFTSNIDTDDALEFIPGGTSGIRETWQWTVPVTVTDDTTFVVIGHGLYTEGSVIKDVTYPEFPDERAEITVRVLNAIIDVNKTADTAISKAGDIVNYTVTINNIGQVALNNITVTDTLLGDISSSFADSLAPGASETHAFPYTVPPGAPDPLVNTVIVNAVPTGSATAITDTATATVDLVHPSLAVGKTASPTSAAIGQTVTYTISVANTGDIHLRNLTVVDSLLGDLSGSFAGGLAPGESESHTFPYVIPSGAADPVVNTVTAHANPLSLPNDITGSASATVRLLHPDIDVSKTANTTISKTGDVVTYTITVSNPGDTALVNITVVDNLLGDLSASFADTLAPGASESHSFPYTVPVGAADPLVNMVTVHANPQGSATDIADTASVTVDLVHPGIEVTKTVSPTSASVGQTVTYTISIANTGDVTLVNITVADSVLGNLSASFADSLAPLASESHNFPYVIPASATDTIVNTVTVHSNPQGLPNDISGSAFAEVDIVATGEGLTPGYWKNHPAAWVGYSTTARVDSVFVIPGSLSSLADDTLMQALEYKGGSKTIGAAQILLRQAVAAVLNASSPTISYPISKSSIISQVNAALASLTRDTMLTLKDTLDKYNNLGGS